MPIAPETREALHFPLLQENTSVGTAGRELRKKKEELLMTANESVFWAATILFRRAQQKVWERANLRSNWDTYGAPAPNAHAVGNAMRILGLMSPSDLAAVNIVSSAEGGIGFCFASGDRYADIESSNEGEIIGVRYVGMETPVLIQTDGTDGSIQAALQEIRVHMAAQTPR